jgi:AcrR family transcriptional regulator/lambda repressor-like predicted transcriptional regulator
VDPQAVPAHRAALGTAVRELRRWRGLTLRDLSRLMGTSAATLSAIENGRTGTSTERVVALADALGVRVDRLLTGAYDAPADGRWQRTVAESGPTGPLPDWRAYEPLDPDPALRGALASFLELGYHGSTMRGIAERAGLSVAGLYHYYGSKQQMLVTVLDLTMSDLAARTDLAAAGAADPAERFAHLVECMALYHTHRRELAFIGATEMRSLAAPARERIAAIRSREQRKVDDPVAEACASGAFGTTRPHEASRAVVTMCTALANWYRPGGPATPEQIAAQYVELALDLVRCDPAVRPGRGA